MRQALVVVLLIGVAAGCSGEPSEASLPAKPSVAGEAPSPSPSVAAPQPALEPAGFATVRRYTDMFYRGELEPLFESFSDEMQDVLPLEQLTAVHEHAVAEYGRETGVIGEDSQVSGEYRGFVRWARFDRTDEVIEIQWILRADDAIAGFYIRPAKKRIEAEGEGGLRR